MPAWEKYYEPIQQPEFQRKSWCYIDKSKQWDSLESFNASNQDFFKLLEWLDWYWKTEHKLYEENPYWPILVIFREDHEDNQVKKENFEVFKAFRQYFNFLVTEWADYELSPQVSSLQLDTKATISFILWWFASFSSVALEEYYWDSLSTCWVDLSHEGFKKLNKKKKIKRSMEEIGSDVSVDEMLSRMESNLKLLDDHINNNVVKDRNSLWLKNTKWILLSWSNSNWKNFIPIISWGAHKDNLVIQAKDYLFRWVIVFTSDSYK